jgi:PAS domain S-box-containing protein
MSIMGEGRDITERKRAEEALRESEIKYRDMVEQINDVIFTTDMNGIFTYISPTIEILGGYKPEEMIGHPMGEFLDPLFLPKIKEQFQKIMTGMLEPTEYRVKIKSGKFRWVRSSSRPILKENKPVGMSGVLTEITQRKQAEETVNLLSHAVKSITECVSLTDLNNRILFVNQAFLDLYGYSEADVIGKTIGALVVPGGTDNLEIINTTLKGGWQGELVNRKKDGTEFPISLSASAVLDDFGKAVALVRVATDITVQKKLQQELLQSQKMQSIGTLAGGIAHDFNNILGIILAYITSFKRFEDDTKKFDIAIETITKAVERGKTLVQQILTFARKTETEFRAVNVNDVIMEIMTMIYETFPKILTYTQNYDKGISYIYADHSQVYQALLNLCVNARDAMPKGGVLTINTRMVSGISLRTQHPDADASSYVCIEVNDTGEGMTEDICNRIFEPFFTTKEQGKGTGLGLAVVFGVVQTHKGFIDVESELEKGTTFRLYLPASQVAEPISVKDEETLEEILGGTETLLVVEDEEMLMMPLQIVLVEKGYKVFSAEDGLTALKIYHERKNDIALVLTDLGLPTITGLEVCQRIKKINPNERMVVATGYLDPYMKSELLKAGIQHFLYKPYDLKKVLKVVREVLDGK